MNRQRQACRHDGASSRAHGCLTIEHSTGGDWLGAAPAECSRKRGGGAAKLWRWAALCWVIGLALLNARTAFAQAPSPSKKKTAASVAANSPSRPSAPAVAAAPRLDVELLWLGRAAHVGSLEGAAKDGTDWLWLSSRGLVSNRLGEYTHISTALLLPSRLQGQSQQLKPALVELDHRLAGQDPALWPKGMAMPTPQVWAQGVVQSWAETVPMLDEAMLIVQGAEFKVLWVGRSCRECRYVYRKDVLLAGRSIDEQALVRLANDAGLLIPAANSGKWEPWLARVRQAWPAQVALRSAVSWRARGPLWPRERAQVQVAINDALQELARVQAWHDIEELATTYVTQAWEFFIAGARQEAAQAAVTARTTFAKHPQVGAMSALWRARLALAYALSLPLELKPCQEALMQALRAAPKALDVRLLAAQVAVALGDHALARRHLAIALAYASVDPDELEAHVHQLGLVTLVPNAVLATSNETVTPARVGSSPDTSTTSDALPDNLSNDLEVGDDSTAADVPTQEQQGLSADPTASTASP